MIIKNIQVFQENGTFESGELIISGTKIRAAFAQDAPACALDHPFASPKEQVLDGEGAYAIPGLTDIHFHGCVGYDFCDGSSEAIEAMASYELKNGITQICPATMTLPEDTLLTIAATARSFAEKQAAAGQPSSPKADSGQIPLALLVGINMEGPFLSTAKKGAQNPLYLRKPDLAMFERLQNAADGLFKLVDIAPEEEGSMEFIHALKDQVVLSLAHTTADYETARKAFQAGASHVTHLFNAMPPFSHRAPGVIGAAFDTPGCQVELICDGIHIAPSMVRAAFQLFGDDRVILISDSMMATGLTDGDYALGGQAVKVQGPLAALADGTIAGSATNLMDCLRRAVKEMGIPLGTAVKCAAVNPAKSIGIYDRFGSLEPGKDANLVLLNQDLSIRAVIFQGQIISGPDIQ